LLLTGVGVGKGAGKGRKRRLEMKGRGRVANCIKVEEKREGKGIRGRRIWGNWKGRDLLDQHKTDAYASEYV